MTGSLKQLVLIWAMVFGLFAVVTVDVRGGAEARSRHSREFLVDLERGDVHEVVMRTRDNSLRVERARGVDVHGRLSGRVRLRVGRDSCAPARSAFDIEPGGSGFGGMLLRVLLPVALLLGLWLLVLRRSTGAGGRYGTFGRAPARQLAADATEDQLSRCRRGR